MSIFTKEKIPAHYKDSLLEDRNKFNSNQLLVVFIFIFTFCIIMSIHHYINTSNEDHLSYLLYWISYIALGLLSIIFFIPYHFFMRTYKKFKKLGAINLFYIIFTTLIMNFLNYVDIRYGHDLISYFGVILVLSTVLWLRLRTYLFISLFSVLLIILSITVFKGDREFRSYLIPQIIVIFLLGWILYLNNRNSRRDDYLHRKLLEAYSKRLLEKSMVEPMTGFYNRRTMEEGLKKVHAIHNRANKKYCVMLVDIDFFKKINDTLGHVVGDSVIKETSKIIQSEMRESDIGYRYGGEEFLFVLSNSTLEEGKVLAERIRSKIQDNNFSELKWNITVSIGITESQQDITPLEMIEIADNCLYKAKEGGRNLVVS